MRQDRIKLEGTTSKGKHPQRIISYKSYDMGYLCECIECKNIAYKSPQLLRKGYGLCSVCKSNKGVSKEDIEVILNLLELGHSAAYISREINKTERQIATVKNDHGITNANDNLLTFREIGEKLDISIKVATSTYESAITKIQSILNERYMRDNYEFI